MSADSPRAPRAKPRLPGATARRVSFAIILTALMPLVAGTFLAREILARVSATAFQPEFGAHLDRALGVYADLAKALKATMRAEAEAIAASAPLAEAAAARDESALGRQLDRAFEAHPSLVELTLDSCSGDPIAHRARAEPVDPKVTRTLSVHRSMTTRDAPVTEGCSPDRPGEPFALAATFATPRARLDELEDMQAFTAAYHQVERGHREEYLDDTYSRAFAALLLGTLAVATFAASFVVRPVTRRIAELAAATRLVGEGDLSVRVGLAGDDEVAELGRAFDRMLEELSESRARVEFLKRVGEWQSMARRLAHEIKNPLTPIQLAVEECHKRYRGDDDDYRHILQTTFEVVQEEVASLRRLVTEFSSFARLPRAVLKPKDLGDFLREQAIRFEARDSSVDDADDADAIAGVKIAFAVAQELMPAVIDDEMLHRVLENLIKNSAQAVRDAKKGGRVEVSSKIEKAGYVIDVDDDGPGIPAELAAQLFVPYVTTKRDGTGLGLSIVKKIVVDHGGSITAGASPLGGARFHIVIPRDGSADAKAALERAVPSSVSMPTAR